MNAALVGINFKTGQIMYQPFDGETAIDDCHVFKSSIASDFPEMTFGVVADEEACEARVTLYFGGNTTTGAVDLLDSSEKSALVAQPANH